MASVGAVAVAREIAASIAAIVTMVAAVEGIKLDALVYAGGGGMATAPAEALVGGTASIVSAGCTEAAVADKLPGLLAVAAVFGALVAAAPRKVAAVSWRCGLRCPVARRS